VATLAIFPYPWAADLHCTFALARKLERRGHRVIVCAIPDVGPRVSARGHPFVPVLRDAFPPGSLQEQNRDEARGRVHGERTFDAVFRRILDALAGGEIERVTGTIRPDALLVSSWTPWVAIAAHGTGLPVACFSSILVSVADSRVPPFGSDTIPRDTPWSRLRTRLSWESMLLRARLFGRGAISIRGPLTDLARRCGYPPAGIDFRVETWPRLREEEIILCPEPFDFPRTRLPHGAAYAEACVDLERTEGEFPWDQLAPDRPLVLCSLGSVVVHKFRVQTERLIQCFLDAMAARPRWQGVAALGRHTEPGRLRAPGNVLMVEEVPQVELLKRASLLVTHGGLTSVKESILLGVPMVVIPFYFDQPGNAARVVHHGLGTRACLATLTAAKLGALMDETIDGAACRAGVAALSRTFRQLEDLSPAARAIERLLDGERSPRRSLSSPRRAGENPPPPRS